MQRDLEYPLPLRVGCGEEDALLPNRHDLKHPREERSQAVWRNEYQDCSASVDEHGRTTPVRQSCLKSEPVGGWSSVEKSSTRACLNGSLEMRHGRAPVVARNPGGAEWGRALPEG